MSGLSLRPFVVLLGVWLNLGLAVAEPALGAQRSDSGDRTMIVVFGASYAKSWPIDRIGGVKVVNAGIGGNETKDMTARYEQDVLSLSPDYVLFWGFINDFTRNKPEQAAQLTTQIQQRYQAMIETALQRGIKPILATEVTMPAATSWWGEILAWVYRLLGRKGYADRINTNVMGVNAWLKDYARQHGLPLLDLQATLAPGGFYRRRQYSQPDGSHLTEAAYRALTEYTRSQEATLLR